MDVLLTKIVYEKINNKPLLHLYGRKSDGGFYHSIVTDFKPFFYTTPIYEQRIRKIAVIEKINILNIYNKPVIKVITEVPENIHKIKKHLSMHYEADVRYEDKFRISKNIYSQIKVPDKLYTSHKEILANNRINIIPRLAYFDIETWDKNGVPKHENPLEEIYSISYFDNILNKFYLFYWDGKYNNDDIDKVITEKMEYELKKYETEEDMLDSFIKFIKLNRPDYLMAWNVNFDYYYMNARLTKLKLKNIPQSINTFDLMNGFKNLYGSKLLSKKLDYCAEITLGKKKMDVGRTWQLKKQNRLDLLYAYNLVDTWLIVELDKVKGIFNYHQSIATIAGCDINDTHYNSKVVDMYILHEVNGKVVLPSKQFIKKKDKSFKGGYVSEPQKGIYEYVAVVDLKAQYPSIMLTFNMSPDTITNETKNVYTLYNANYKKKPKSIIYNILKSLIFKRDALKAEMNKHDKNSKEYKLLNAQQNALKFLTNSFYGVMGSDIFRLAVSDIASDVTAIGRDMRKYIDTKTEELGYSVLYGDTDSSMFLTNDTDLENAVDAGLTVVKVIKDGFFNFSSKYGVNKEDDIFFDIKLEKIYRKWFQSGSKKRYVGLIEWMDGKYIGNLDFYDRLDIKGFEIKRANIAPLTKKVQKHIIYMMFNNEEDKISSYIMELKKKIYGGEMDLEILIPASLNRGLNQYKSKQSFIRAIEYAVEYNIIDTDNLYDTFLWTYTKKPMDVMAFPLNIEKIPNNVIIDRERMFERIILNPLKPFIEGLEINLDGQTNLEDFL